MYDGQGIKGDAFLMGLIDTSKLESQNKTANNHECDEKQSGEKSDKAVAGRGKVGAVSDGGQTAQSVAGIDVNAHAQEKNLKRASGTIENAASHRTHPLAAAGGEL